MKHNIKIVGDVGQVKTKEVSLKQNLMAKTKSDVALREKSQIKPDTQQVLRPRDTFKEFNNLELKLEIKPGGPVDMRNPLGMVSVGDGTVILVDKELNYLQMINTEGNVVRKYQVTLSQQSSCASACVYGDYLFVTISDNVITKMSLNGSDCNIEYKAKGVGTINNITATGENVVLISNVLNGTILEYNTETNKVIQRVTSLWLPGKVRVVQAGPDTKYIVKYFQKYNIYNKDWNLISEIDNNSEALTVTPGGKLLIAYSNRIYEYSHDGSFVRDLLVYRFNETGDITYSGGFLWVLEKRPYVISGIIKIFHSS